MIKLLHVFLYLNFILACSIPIQIYSISNYAKIAFGVLASAGAAGTGLKLSPFDLERYRHPMMLCKPFTIASDAQEPQDLQQFLDEHYTDNDVVDVPKDWIKLAYIDDDFYQNGQPYKGNYNNVGFDALYEEMLRIKNVKVPFYQKIKNYIYGPTDDRVCSKLNFPVIIKPASNYKREKIELRYVSVPKKLLIKIYYNIIMSNYHNLLATPGYTPYINGKFEGYGVTNEISNVWYDGMCDYREWRRAKQLTNQKD